MKVSNLRKNQHLMWRAGFGPGLKDLDHIASLSHKGLLRKMLKDSSEEPPYIDVADPEVKSGYMSPAEMMAQSKTVAMEEDKISREAARRRLAQISRGNIKILNVTWLNQMAVSKQQLREKMSLFWHGHFAAQSGNIIHQQQLLDIIRRHALGNFGDLLREVSKSATMINYLNNNQNRKNRPNENFAREVMELFTMGRGNYSEKDIKEAARAFTGWGANPGGEFVFRKQQHDDNEKIFLGKTGNFNGDDILNMLLEQKQTAWHITTKIYRFYVNENEDQEKIKWLADRFHSSGYDIKKLMQDIFESDWFYSPENIGNRIKSPVELLTGIRRTLSLNIENAPVQLLFQRLLGQLLFYPPNVAGWPGGYTWIDSSSLMLRLQIPKMIIDSQEVKLAPKDNDDQMMGMKDQQVEKTKRKNNQRSGAQVIQATIDWNDYVAKFKKVKRDQLLQHITDLILIPQNENKKLIADMFVDKESRESFIKSATIQIMCTPEYQLC